MNTILASVNALPKLINGKVAVITSVVNKHGHIQHEYCLHKPVQWCTIEDNFDPIKYSILKNPKYRGAIVYSTREEQEHYLVTKQLSRIDQYQVGKKIHLFSRNGTYTIIRRFSDWHYLVSCKKWETLGYPPKEIHLTDIKCLAGGINNL